MAAAAAAAAVAAVLPRPYFPSSLVSASPLMPRKFLATALMVRPRGRESSPEERMTYERTVKSWSKMIYERTFKCRIFEMYQNKGV